MNTIQKISLIVAGISLSYWFFAAIDNGFELFDLDYWEDGFDEWYLQLSLSIFVGSIISYFVFDDKDRNVIINLKKNLDFFRNTVKKHKPQVVILLVIILTFILAISQVMKNKRGKQLQDELYNYFKEKAAISLLRNKVFPREQFSKVKGTGSMNYKQGAYRYAFFADLYNGSSWKINTIKIEVDIYSKRERKLLVTRRISRKLGKHKGLPYTKVELPFFGAGDPPDLPFLESKYQTYEWRITEIRGEPQNN